MVLNRILSCTCKWRMRRFGASHTMWLLPWQSVVSVSHLRSLASVRFQKELSPFMRPYWIGFVFDGLFWHFQMEKLENLGKTHDNKRRMKKGKKKYKRIKFGTRILQKKISSISMNHVTPIHVSERRRKTSNPVLHTAFQLTVSIKVLEWHEHIRSSRCVSRMLSRLRSWIMWLRF